MISLLQSKGPHQYHSSLGDAYLFNSNIKSFLKIFGQFFQILNILAISGKIQTF